MYGKLIEHIKHTDDHLNVLLASKAVPLSVKAYIQEFLLNKKHKELLEEVKTFEEGK